MKIEKLTDNKIRIIINFEELSEKNIDIFNLPDSKEKIYPPYKYEIEMIRNKKFDKELIDKIKKQ